MGFFPRVILSVLLVAGLMCGGIASSQTLRWFDDNQPTVQAKQALTMLAGAADDGLDPSDYRARVLSAAFLAAGSSRWLTPAEFAQLDALLTRSMRDYLHDLHVGRVDPRSLHQDYPVPPPDPFDEAALLDAVLSTNQLADAVARAEPPLAQYRRLRSELAFYRERISHPAWHSPLPASPELADLAPRLAALGDLADSHKPSAAGINKPNDPEVLVGALKSFQRRHGLPPVGAISAETLARLEITPAKRARQIELTMERLRWTPVLQAPRMVVVNIPEFVLRAYEVHERQITVRAEMKVVVGKALNKRTPLFDAMMRSIEFSPYWNVPVSIARDELVPKMKRGPALFKRDGFEFVGSDGRGDPSWSVAKLDEVLAGRLRLRQRPGPLNALGKIKFVLPNHDDIYLHHTPSTQLFERSRRDFSHGCVRLEHPLALARFVLAGMPDWPEARIREAMDAGVSSRLSLVAPLPVLIAYGTAVAKADGLYFYDDLYGHDRLLDAALNARKNKHLP